MSRVFFTDLRATPTRSILDKVADLLNRLKIGTKIRKGDLAAITRVYQEVARRLGILPESGPSDLKGPETMQ